ncbi:ArnT family glycosyltransferase [Phenylobacterium sp.]|uniref:ArnT family glycosyltransferase n=1 Tax=Phenylobacterium sp. TaxID=1871053 RepID=UPI0035B450DA
MAWTSSPRARLWLFVALATLVRVLAARWTHLTEDEAYYRLWAQHLAFGYYDHPPMIAWWIRAGIGLAGDNPLGVRLAPILATALEGLLIADIVKAFGGSDQAGLRAAVWLNATITVGVGGMLAVPDAPGVLFWLVTLWALRRAQLGAPAWWLAAGAAAGLAVLSKYSGLFLGAGVFLWLVADAERRALLKTRWPWLALAAAAAVVAPNVIWNAGHHWVTLAKQFGRVTSGHFSPGHVAELLVAQTFLLNPMVASYAARGLAMPWRASTAARRADLALPVLMIAPFAGYLLLHGLHASVQGHWPAPMFGPLVVCAAFAAEEWPGGAGARLWRLAGAWLGLLLSVAVLWYMTQMHSPAFGAFDPILALRGWREFSLQVEAERRKTGAEWVGTVSYGTLAELQSERLIDAPVAQIFERERYAFEPKPPAGLDRPGLVVDLARRLKPDRLESCFASVTYVAAFDRGLPSGPAARYAAYLVSGPKVDVARQGCPESRERLHRRFQSGG